MDLHPVSTNEQTAEFLDKLIEAFNTRLLSKDEAIKRILDLIAIKQNQVKYTSTPEPKEAPLTKE